MHLHVVAVQADMRPAHYQSEDAFYDRIQALAQEAVAGSDGAPTLIAFPEAIGLPLAFGRAGVLAAGSVRGASWAAVRSHAARLVGAAWRHRRVGPSLFFLLDAETVFEAYTTAFGNAARATGATIVAGTAFLPGVEREAARDVHVADPAVRNVAFTFGPGGKLLGRTGKTYLMPQEAASGLVPAPLDALQPVDTPVGRIGVAVCLDAFYEGVVDRLDGLAASIVVQPSANHAPWDRRWPHDPGLSEGEAWWRHGLREGIQQREHLQIGVNPMLVGEVLDLAPRGRSSIVVNRRFHPDHQAEGWPGLVAAAPTPDREAYVRATLELKDPADVPHAPANASERGDGHG